LWLIVRPFHISWRSNMRCHIEAERPANWLLTNIPKPEAIHTEERFHHQ
jgi:hypothetical protein